MQSLASALLVPAVLVLAATAPALAHGPEEPTANEARSKPASKDPAPADEDEDDDPGVAAQLPDATVVTATRTPRRSFETPYSTDTIGQSQLEDRTYRTTPQALRDTPGVMVQETSHGQGSPYIRGFTGFRNVFLIDGIRLNNSVFRDGPNQYWNTVDPWSLQRIEVVKGPGSVIWGSDAIGGTVHAITKNPYTYGEGTNVGGELFYRIASAEESHVVRGEASVTSGDDFGVLIGGTGKHFGDYQAGSDLGTQPNTGYDEWDADLKLESFLDEDTRVVFGYQRVQQNNVPRTHQTVFSESFEGSTIGSDLRRDLDQDRELTYLQMHGEGLDGGIEDYSFSLSWHDQEEVRDRIRGSGVREKQGFDVGTLGLLAKASSSTSVGRITYGLDYYHDSVDSFSTTNPVQGPVADDSTYELLGVYVQDEIPVSERLDLIVGGRFDYAAADADSVLDPVTSTEFSIEDDWSAFVGSARFVYEVSEDTVNLFGGVSQGFRAPNLSDLTRFDTARTNEFEIPSPGLDPEEFITYEVGLKTRHRDTSTQVSVFYTDVQDMIVRFPTGNVNPDGEFEITKDNVGDGYVYGVEVGASRRVAPSWTVFGNATFLRGEIETFPTSAPVLVDEPIDREMPLTGQLGLRWDSDERDRWAELVAMAADDADRLSTRDMGDTSRIPPGGTPGYVVFHARAGTRVGEHTTVDVALENLTDEDYRVHGSGQNMPGLNLVVGVRASF